MNRALLSLVGGLVLMSRALADRPPPTQTDLNEGVQFSKEGSGADTHFDLSWWGRANWTYFFQVSEDLVTWRYFPEIVVLGSQGKPIGPASFNVSGTDRFFVRLRHLPFAITDPFDADTDGDKVSNRDEFASGTDPLLTDPVLPFRDADGDGMSDDWERQYGLKPNDPSDATGPNSDPDEDGVSNLIEFQTGTFGTDPTDYYRGNFPAIRVVGWTFPTDEPGTLVSQPLVFEFTRGVNPATKVVNAPVTVFTEGPNEGLLSETPAGTGLAVRLPLRTDANGQVRVFFKHPSAIPPVPTQRIIHVRAGSAAPNGHFAEGTVSATSQFNYTYPPNTVGRSASEAIDSRIAAALAVPTDPELAKRIFSTQDHNPDAPALPTYVRNTAAWCYHDLNNNNTSNLRQAMTCISPWNSEPGNPGHERGAGTAITAQHIVLSAHYVIPPDTKVRFITADNVVVEKVVQGAAVHPDFIFQNYYPDLIVYTLDSPLPSTITPCKVLPDNYAAYLSYLENGRPPVLMLDQEEKALVSELRELGNSASLPNFSIFVKPGLHRNRGQFYEEIVLGDSGNPAFLILKPPNTGLETLVLLHTATAAGPGRGTFVTPQISKLNEMIVAADANATSHRPDLPPIITGMTVQAIDLGISGFNTFTPP